MKIGAYYALHYGAEYLAWSLRSIAEQVDHIVVLYTPQPSYGTPAPMPCPESEDRLKLEARRFVDPHRIEWIRGHWHGEGAHRDQGLQVLRALGCDIAIPVDADELWMPDTIRAAAEHAHRANSAYAWLCHFEHFWRALDRTVHDGFRPVRVVDLRQPVGTQAYMPLEGGQVEPIYHTSCAQAEAITRYKWSCHGHQSELRQNWLEEKFFAWTPEKDPGDLHPVVFNLWDYAHEASPTTRAAVDTLLHDHPNYGKPVIR